MIGRDLQDTQQDSDGVSSRMIIHDEKSLVVNVSKSDANKKVALTGFAGYSELDVTARIWTDTNNDGEPSPGETSDNPVNTKRFKRLPGFTLGAGLSFLASDHFTIRLEKDKTWYKATKSVSFADLAYTNTIKPRTENIAIGLTYKW
jgi:opacity protein-like surface antigen